MIVTIDGPAGSGKSSAAGALARRLGFRFLDTGGMYRTVTLAALREGISLEDRDALAAVAKRVTIELVDNRVLLDGEDVTGAIRTFEIATLTHHVADHPEVRTHLVHLQRQAADGLDVVTEGRDQGTVAFPDAQCKIFLTASERVRAERRYHDLLQRGEQVTFEEVLAKQQDRDHRDMHREVGALLKAHDAIELVTDGMSHEEVVDRLHQLVEAKRSEHHPPAC